MSSRLLRNWLAVTHKAAEYRHARPCVRIGLGQRRNYAPMSEAVRKKQEEPSPADVLEQLELIQYQSDRLNVDPWLTSVSTFDLHLPSYKSHKKNATLTDHLRAIYETQKNRVYNVMSMWRIARDNAFPGIKVRFRYSPQLLRAQSTSSSAWLAPFRKTALDTYKQLNEAVANRDVKTIRKFTAMDEQLHYLKLSRQQDQSLVYVWKFLGERSPCRVLSIRANIGHMGREDLAGSKLIVQALVKFDTLQGVDVYKRGKLVHSQQPKPVVEYLVLQKRLWLNTPWVVRGRAYEGVDGQFEQ